MSESYCLALCTCPDENCAEQLAQSLIEQHIASCINLLPGVRSIYPWQGQIERAQETLMLIKTRTDQWQRLEDCVRQQHPYELPELLLVPVERGSSEYLDWVGTWLDSRN